MCSSSLNITYICFFFYLLFQEEHGTHLDPAVEVEDDRLNGLSGSTSSAALHYNSGPKKKRHRIPRQEKDKDPQVGEGCCCNTVVNSSIVRQYSVSYNYLDVFV